MKDRWGDVFAVAGQQASGFFVDDDDARRVGSADAFVGVVHAGAGVQVEVIAVDQDGTVRGVVGPDAGGGDKVADPDDVGVEGAGFEEFAVGGRRERFGFDVGAGFGRHAVGVGGGHVRGFVLEGAVVAVSHAQRVEAEDFAAVIDDVDAVVFDGGGGTDAGFGPVEVGIFPAFWDDELPEERAVAFIEAHQDAAVADVFRVAGDGVVGADVDAAVGDDGGGVGFGAERGGPFDVLAGGEVESVGEIFFVGEHVARPGLAPLRLVGGED